MRNQIAKLLACLLVMVLLCAGIGAFAEETVPDTLPEETTEPAPQLSTMTLPAALQAVGEEVFYGAALEKVVLPEGIVEIGARAFAQSTLSEIVLPSTLTSIADDAFEGCGELTVTVPEDCYAYDWCVEKGLVPDPYEVNMPTSVYFTVTGVNLIEGESITLVPKFTSDKTKFNTTVRYETSNSNVADVDDAGLVTALAAGMTEISVETANGLTAICVINVAPADTVPSLAFGWESATIVAGDSADLDVVLNKAVYDRGFTIESSDPELLEVDEKALTITAKAAGSVTLSLKLNPVEEGGEPSTDSTGSDGTTTEGTETGGTESDGTTTDGTETEGTESEESAADTITCAINVIAGTEASFSAETITLWSTLSDQYEYWSAPLSVNNLPEDLIGTFSLGVEESDEILVIYDESTETVYALDVAGTTRIVLKTFNQEIYCTVNVISKPTYRALIVAEFNNSGASNDLPFSANNANAMYKVLSEAKVDSETGGYEKITKLFSNPSKTEIKNGIDSTFEDAVEGDVSVIYIVSHGYDVAANGGYHFGMSNYNKNNSSTYVGHAELMEWISAIKGDVVLVVDSCKSGGFIRDEQSALESAGNISVLTAQYAEKNASFYDGVDSKNDVEFLTWVFCRGVGWDYNTSSTLNLLADDNSDSCVSVYESFDYCVDEVPGWVVEKALSDNDITNSNEKNSGFRVPGIDSESELNAWLYNSPKGQVPQIYIPTAMRDLVIFGK